MGEQDTITQSPPIGEQDTITQNPPIGEQDTITQNPPIGEQDTIIDGTSQITRGQRIGILVPHQARDNFSFVRVAYQAIFDHASEDLVFIFEDSGVTEQQAIHATEKLIEKGVDIILGPLTGRQTNAIKPLIDSHSITMLSFSNDIRLAGDNVYIFGFTPQGEIIRVFSYLYDKGYRRFAALTPQEPYGQAVKSALDRIQTAYPLISLQQQEYAETRDHNSIQNAIMQFVAQAEKGVTFDVLFLADRVEVGKFIVDFLLQQGIERSKYILVGPSFLWRNMTANVDPLLLDAIFAAPVIDKQKDFMEAFQSTYGYLPPKRALLMYDAVNLATVLAQNMMTASSSLPSITGIHGPITLKSQGIVQHSLAVYIIGEDTQQIIDSIRQEGLEIQ